MKKLLSLVLCAVMLLALMPVLTQTVSAQSLTKFDIRLDEPVASYNPDFTPKFNTDAQVYTTVTWQENSPGFSAKLNSSDEFKAGIAYKAVIWVKFGDGYNLATDQAGDLAAALTVNGKAISSLKIEERNSRGQIVAVTITCEYGPLSGMEISRAQVTGIPTPVAGKMPIYSFTLGSNNAYGFYPTQPIVWWDKTTGKEMDSGDTFVVGHIYQLEIWLAANREQGFTFRLDSRGEPSVNVTLNSWAPDSVITAYEQDPREVIAIHYTFPACQAAHTCSPKLVPQQDPTCLMYGFKAYYECSCGLCYADAKGQKPITDMDGYGIIPALGHVEGGWSFNGTHHYKKCTRCREVIPGTEVAHSGGTLSCLETGKCSTCGYGYLQPSEDAHVYESKWTARGDMYHFHKCIYCGAHGDIADHVPGPAATETTPQICKICKYVIAPAKNHTHKLTKVELKEPTCTEPGNKAYFACEGCSELFADEKGKTVITDVELAPLGHAVSDSWGYDQECHWRTCSNCHMVLEETKMSHEGAPCTTCGYVLGAQIPEETTQPTTQPEDPEDPWGFGPGQSSADTKDSKETDLTWLWILLMTVGGATVGVVATVLVLKKKKE